MMVEDMDGSSSLEKLGAACIESFMRSCSLRAKDGALEVMARSLLDHVDHVFVKPLALVLLPGCCKSSTLYSEGLHVSGLD